MSKIFANDEILTAEDVNEHLNPFTAAHIAYAVAAGTFTAPALVSANSSESYTIPLPPGRFTQTPLVFAINQFASGASGSRFIVGARGESTTQATLSVANLSSNPRRPELHWFAIQMTPDSAQG